MASYLQGYDEERFVTSVNRNFICLICFNVLKDPVLCPKNQHCFCRGCITKHLENAKRCPTCADELTVHTLIDAPRMVKVMLNELKICCVYINRGCKEILELQYLDSHEATCGFTPAVCTNQGCGATVNQRDLIHHESEVCEFRKLKCHSCEKMTKTLENMEKRMANVEKYMATNAMKMESVLSMETKMKTQTNVTGNMEERMANVETKVVTTEKKLSNMEKSVATMEKNIERNVVGIKTDMKTEFEKVNNDVIGLKTALIKSFDEMKDVLLEIKKENARKVRNTPSGDREKIIVAGGAGKSSVEMFNWREKTWSSLQPMEKNREGATSFVYNNHMTVVGGRCGSSGEVDNMVRMNVELNSDLAGHWTNCPFKLLNRLVYHSSVLYQGCLIVTGGYDGNLHATSDLIYELQFDAPYFRCILSRMLKRRRYHNTHVFDHNLLIAGGRTTDSCKDNLSSVVLYDIKKRECKQLAPLPYEVSKMATVKWGDNIVVIGGIDKRGKALNTVIIYNVKTEQSHMLPPMKFKRWGCTAVVIRNYIVVLGGYAEQGSLKSVEAFSFENYTWEELPEMSQARYYHTAVAV